ncbi:hypothetical protein [Mycetocola reblochoni]|uniref:Uncharacterized protein n=2 Tax=Mycetocola reblochoni TaxID=331618 RepID=A0A1R4INK3_9MICO|nr:hypothetical protein [Mycetocola reblochoni]RLP67887.1 hypothetical protein D9V30_12170 [Mycetocola reblochoni]SJN21451.1 hypothetical protein FM119_02795 [Mycetocola reblochoni REB411]
MTDTTAPAAQTRTAPTTAGGPGTTPGTAWLTVLAALSLVIELVRATAGLRGHGGGTLTPYFRGEGPSGALAVWTVLLIAVTVVLYAIVIVLLRGDARLGRLLGGVLAVLAVLAAIPSIPVMVGAGAIVGVVFIAAMIVVNVAFVVVAWRGRFCA